MSFTYGIDVSNHQKLMDWMIVAQQGLTFALIKASQADFSDRSFAKHWAGSKAAGLLRGAYHFYVENTTGHRQAQQFLTTLGNDTGELPPIVDLEKLSGAPIMNPRKFADNVLIWLQEVEAAVGRRPIIYTTQGFWNEVMRINNAFPTWAPNYELWVANFKPLGFRKGARLSPTDIQFSIGALLQNPGQVALPKSWEKWRFWQFTGDVYKLDGVRTLDMEGREVLSSIDLDMFAGTEDQLRAWAGVAAGAAKPRYVDIAQFTNQKVMAGFMMAFGAQAGQVLAGTGLQTQLSTQPTLKYLGPGIQDIPSLSFEQELALNSALIRQVSNQKVINAFFKAFGVTTYWDVVISCNLQGMAAAPQDAYIGPLVNALPLTAAQKAKLQAVWPIAAG